MPAKGQMYKKKAPKAPMPKKKSMPKKKKVMK